MLPQNVEHESPQIELSGEGDAPTINLGANVEPEQVAEELNSEILDNEVSSKWEEAKQYFSDKGMPRVSAAFEFEAKKTEAFVLALELPNATLKSAIDENKQEILQYLKKLFQVPEIQLNVEVKKEVLDSTDTPSQLKSANQKFKELSVQNPELILLIEKLGMEPLE